MPSPPRQRPNLSDNNGNEPPLRELPMICDDDQWFRFDDWEYVNNGEAEGWLKYTGSHLDGNNIFWHRFVMVNVG